MSGAPPLFGQTPAVPWQCEFSPKFPNMLLEGLITPGLLFLEIRGRFVLTIYIYFFVERKLTTPCSILLGTRHCLREATLCFGVVSYYLLQ